MPVSFPVETELLAEALDQVRHALFDTIAKHTAETHELRGQILVHENSRAAEELASGAAALEYARTVKDLEREASRARDSFLEASEAYERQAKDLNVRLSVATYRVKKAERANKDLIDSTSWRMTRALRAMSALKRR